MIRRLLLALLVAAVYVLVVRQLGPTAERLTGALAERIESSRGGAVVTSALPEGEWAEVKQLGGPWQFRLGDNPNWRDAPDDGAWESVPVPSSWEDAGYWGYDGMAWYRRAFELTPQEAARLAAMPAFLYLGRVDDADEVWLNGAYIGGSGRMPDAGSVMGAPAQTAYYQARFYRIPPGLLHADGPNVITVRVWDHQMEGGLLDGTPGLYAATAPGPTAPAWVVDLAGRWRFHPGDQQAWADPAFDDSAWDRVTVPARWESQGFPDLDGYAWYRTGFELKDPEDGPYVLLLGRIDDVDEVWLDGHRIGGTGDVEDANVAGDEWERLRAYPIPTDLLRGRTAHTLAVRVFDGLIDGGIYAGPVGIIRQGEFERLVEEGADFGAALPAWDVKPRRTGTTPGLAW